MPEEVELHSIRRGCRGNRRLLPGRLVSYKLPARLAFRTAAQLPRSPAAAPRLSGQVSASQRIRWHPAPQLDWRGDDFRNAHDKGLHDVGMLQQDLLDLGDVDAADLDHLLQPASKPSPSTGEPEELNYRLLAPRPGATRKPSEKGLCNFQLVLYPLLC
jgi:hypothetical protein